MKECKCTKVSKEASDVTQHVNSKVFPVTSCQEKVICKDGVTVCHAYPVYYILKDKVDLIEDVGGRVTITTQGVPLSIIEPVGYVIEQLNK